MILGFFYNVILMVLFFESDLRDIIVLKVKLFKKLVIIFKKMYKMSFMIIVCIVMKGL